MSESKLYIQIKTDNAKLVRSMRRLRTDLLDQLFYHRYYLLSTILYNPLHSIPLFNLFENQIIKKETLRSINTINDLRY